MVTRISGLASGMDIDELVKNLMQAERAPLDKLTQQKQTYEWQRDAYRSVNTKLKTFDTYIADNLVLKNLTSKTATSSNSTLVSATATGSATGTLSIEGVSQLATAARGVGTQVNANGDTKLSVLLADTDITLPSSIKLSAIDKQGKMVEPVSIELKADMTVSQLVSSINASSAGVSAIFEGGRLSITAKNTGREVNGGAAITTDEDGKTVFSKLGLDNLVKEEGKNAVFQVNGIATERTTNSFSINGYNVTLNATFNAEKATAEKYNAALTEWRNTTTDDYENSIEAALTAKGTAATDYTKALEKYNSSRNTLFGTVEVSANETAAFNKVYKNLADGELGTIKATAIETQDAYKSWLEDTSSNSELKAKLKGANISFEEFNALKTLDSDKVNTINKQAAFNTLGSTFINGLSDTEKGLILNLQAPKTVESLNTQIETWKKSENEAEKALAKKLAELSESQKTALINTSAADLTDFSEQAAYNTLGVAFLGNLTDGEKGLLKGETAPSTVESLNAKIEEWKKSENATEKALAEKLGKLSDTQKETLIGLDANELSSLSVVATDYLNSQSVLKEKNTTEAEHQALVNRQKKAEVDFKNAYQMEFGEPLPTNEETLAGLTPIDTESLPAATTPVTMTSTTNVDEMLTKIKEFVTTYNGLIKDLTDQTKQSKYRDYAPLTAEQKEAMSENEIKLWEEKAKSGLLRNDSVIQSGLSNMRSLLYQSNPAISDTKYNTLFSIGITTSKDYNSGGTLEIDETKLRKALEENPDAVEKLFKNSEGKKDDVVNGQTVDTRGYLTKLRESMKTIEVNIEKKAGRSTMTDVQYAIGKSLLNVEDRMETWQDKLKTIEDRYWRQFTAMESAINKANSQYSLFAQG